MKTPKQTREVGGKKIEITFDDFASKWVLQTFKNIKPICFNCKRKITHLNLGGIRQGTGMVCKKTLCLMAFAEELKKDWEYAKQ